MRQWQRLVIEGLIYSLAFCIVVLGVCAGRATAQVVKGSISATVVDSTGAAIPGADVQAVNSETGAAYSTKTGPTGLFKLPLLAIGNYTLTISKEGFRKLEMSGVQVTAAQDYGLGSLQLEVGRVTTMVEVMAAPALLQTTEAQISTSISSSMLTEFPGLNMNTGLDNLALMIPGVVSSRDNSFSNSNGASFSVNGIRGRNNDQQIDGANNNDNSVAGPGMFVGNTDFVQEYHITTNNFGPEYGRNAGSVVNIVTKSGTNKWHGDLFGTENNNKLNTLTNLQKAFEGLHELPVLNDEYSGGAIGGPIKKDRVFVFSGFDDEIIPGSAVFATGTLTPTPDGLHTLASCYPNSTSLQALATYGPFGVKGGNPVISGTPTAKLVTPRASSGLPSCSGVQFSGIQRLLNTSYHQYDLFERLDVNGAKDRVYGRVLYQKTTPLNQQGTGSTGYSINVPSLGEQWGISWTRTISSSMVNEFRLNYGRLGVQFGGNDYGNTVPIMGNLANGLASVSLGSGNLGFGPANNFPQGRIVNTYQLQDNWSYLYRRHQLKAGVNLTYQRSPNVFLPNYNGTYTFTNFGDFIANIPSSISITLGNPNLDFREHDSFWYFGDDFKIRPNLTLNLGLTYTYYGQPANLFHNADVRRESGSTPYFNPALPLSVRTFPELGAPKNGVGPSIGFAYSPAWLGSAGKTVLRGGYRLSFDPPFYNIYLNIASSAPQALAQTISGKTPMPTLLAQPYGPANRSELASYLTLGVSDPRSFSESSVTPDFRADHVQLWSFGIQRQLGAHAVLESRYVGNHGGSLFQSVNGNPYIAGLASLFPNVLPSGVTPCATANAVVSTARGRVNCNMGVLRMRQNSAMSDYQGWQNELRTTNLWNQLTLRTSFTWSKTTDNVSEIFGDYAAGNTLAFSQNQFDYIHAEHSLSGLNIPKAWTLSFAEEIPAFRSQKGVVGRILGGWTLAGTYLIASGQPYTPTQQYLAYSMDYPGPFPFDVSFNSSYAGASYENLRPFMANPVAPATQVGIYAGDLCAYDGTLGCSFAANTLLSFNAYNAAMVMGQGTGEATTARNAVRFIVNGPTAEGIYGTPFGNAGRNTLSDYKSNNANFSVYKYIKLTERARIRFDTTFRNVFNHPNFGSIDPYIDDAGVTDEEYGFANTSLQDGGRRYISLGLRIEF